MSGPRSIGLATGAKKVAFRYDYLGRRVEKRVYAYSGDPNNPWPANPTEVRRFVWGGGSAGVSPANGGWLLLAEMVCTDPNDPCDCSSGFQPVKTYTWGLDLAGQMGSVNSLEAAGGITGLLGVLDAQGTPGQGGDDKGYVYLYDGNGNVGQLFQWSTQPQGIEAKYQYDPYGNRINYDPNTPEYDQPFRFSTKQFDPETGLIYFGMRYYDPKQGRWTSHDRIGERGGMNLYAFVRNAPPSGLDSLGQYPGDAAFTPPKEPPRTGCCGPDITGVLTKLLQNVEFWFSSMPEEEVYAACTAMMSPGNWGGNRGWDINQLHDWGASRGSTAFNALQAAGCGTGDCAGSVMVNQRCYRAGEVNYVLWGKLFQQCHKASRHWKWTKRCVTVTVNTEAFSTSYQTCAWYGSKGQILGVAESGHGDRLWFLEEALDLTHQYLSFPFAQSVLGGSPNAAGAGSEACRHHWTIAGYVDSLSVPIGCTIPCATGCCSAAITALSAQFGVGAVQAP